METKRVVGGWPATGSQPPVGNTPTPPNSQNSSLPTWTLIATAVAVVVGAGLALLTIPVWVPVLSGSIVGAEAKVFWYLSRASAFTAFVLLWVSMASGLLISNKMARVWPGAFTAFDLHQYTSLLALGFAAFHTLILLGNRYIVYDLVQLLVPFSNSDYRPLWVSLGQIALYLSILVTFTFYIRKQIGRRVWYIIHLLSYVLFALALVHGIFSGTDTGNLWVMWLYWVCGFSLLALTIYRVAQRQMRPAK